MILSKTANYALRATLCLSEAGDDRPIPVDEIARRLDVPRNYLSKILHVLARADLLTSTRGPGGGFQLARPADSVALSDIVGHFDALPDESTCFLGQSSCNESEPCQAHALWAEVRQSINDFLDDTLLSDLAADERVEVAADLTVGQNSPPG